MAKTLTQFVCEECGARYSKWSGKCVECGRWNSLLEQVPASSSRFAGATALKPERLASISSAKMPRIDTGIPEVNQVLGGGIVPGSVMLLSGDPGVGKSTLVLQVAARVAAGSTVLYVSGEESASQIKLRSERLKLADINLDLLTETGAEQIVATIAAGQYDLVIIDSIQTLGVESLTGSPGTAGQITASAQILQQVAKRTHTAVLIIGHVTKEGLIAGPKILEHLVDVVIYLEGSRYGTFKALRGVKNRFGAVSEVGIFEMRDSGLVPVPNPSEALLAERQTAPGSVVLATLEGTRPLLVEVQALVSKSPFGYPKRTAAGFDINRLNVLVAVLQKRTGLNLSDQDIYVNIVGGLKITEPAADLAIILAIASAYKNQPVAHNLIAFGEVGLSGEIRSVSNVESRIAESRKLGFKSALMPLSKVKGRTGQVANIAQAVETALH
ncbi:MAG TPA: DNA repair protein RadA [Candidatus Dormibacteraeota bacterium]|nr:DNA repair protein RadA [Candidatus Dormibacteraeota bacterium]